MTKQESADSERKALTEQAIRQMQENVTHVLRKFALEMSHIQNVYEMREK